MSIGKVNKQLHKSPQHNKLSTNDIRLEIYKRAEEQLWNRFLAQKNRYDELLKLGQDPSTYPVPPTDEDVLVIAERYKDFVFGKGD